MTEVVKRRMEFMTEEFEEMRRTKLFKPEDVRKVIKKRNEYEHRVNSDLKKLQDFKDYIEYEQNLLGVIRQRRNKLRIGEKKGSLEHKIINRIKNLYETALQRFPSDLALCLTYFKFCKQANYINSACAAILSMLKNHSQNPESWLMAAKWYAYDRKDYCAAVKTACKGIMLHKDCKPLYTEMFAIELYYTVGEDRCKSEDQIPKEKQEMCVKKLETYLTEVVANIRDCAYYIKLLKMIERYEFLMKVQDTIVDHLLKKHPHEVIVWHTLAQRERNGIHYGQDSDSKRNSAKFKLSECFKKYEEGLAAVPDAVKGELWSLYLDYAVEQQRDDFGVAKNFKTVSLKSAFEKANAQGHMSEKYYITWLELVDNVEAVKILEKGTMQYPNSVVLWKLRLQYEIIENNAKEVDKVFRLGTESLKDQALPLWVAVIRYHMLNSEDDIVGLLYGEGVRQPQEVSDVLKPRFIEWLALCKGIRAARKVYFGLAEEKPYCKELHMMMSKLESTEIKHDYIQWEKVHKIACQQFGHESVDVWFNYIDFFCNYKKAENESIREVYERARQNLPESLFLDFRERYSAMIQAE